MTILPTNHPAFLIRQTAFAYTPLLYPFQRKDGTWIEIGVCANRAELHAMKCALRWLDKEDLVCRRELAARGWEVRPIPDLESGPFITMPDVLFSEDPEDIYDRS